MSPRTRTVIVLLALLDGASLSCADDGQCTANSECASGRFCAGGVCVDPRWIDAGATPSGGTAGGSGQGSGAAGTGGQATGLGAVCDAPCQGTWCSSGGSTFIDRTCAGSDLSQPCVGTSAGMFCSHSCSADAECANPIRPMSCLTVCNKAAGAAGRCWTVSSAEFMRTQVCGN